MKIVLFLYNISWLQCPLPLLLPASPCLPYHLDHSLSFFHQRRAIFLEITTKRWQKNLLRQSKNHHIAVGQGTPTKGKEAPRGPLVHIVYISYNHPVLVLKAFVIFDIYDHHINLPCIVISKSNNLKEKSSFFITQVFATSVNPSFCLEDSHFTLHSSLPTGFSLSL